MSPGPAGLPSDEEVLALLDELYERHGLDFRGYALPSLKRRVRNLLQEERMASVAEVRPRALTDPDFLGRLLRHFSVVVTAMFRDPPFWRALRERAVPLLRDRPALRLWHPGCATGEEVYSAAIVLHEEGLRGRFQLLGTDLDDASLERARRARMPMGRMQEYSRNYALAGGGAGLSAYYDAGAEEAALKPWLHQFTTFAQHNLATDPAPGTFDAVICRNVLIYFDVALQRRVLTTLAASLLPGGLLALGPKETLLRGEGLDALELVDAGANLFRKRA